MKKIFNEFEEHRQDTQKANIVKHEKFGPNKVKVTYSNDVEIYVNYGEDEWKLEGITVPPENYIVFK